jgi:hypothetical protein|uniref:hypothetical protein n=1 Tax=uncultured Sphingomonas sp. TaxID=158754 RepID=UPI0035C96994
MAATHDIRLDPVRKLLTLTLTGFFDVSQVAQIHAEIVGGIATLGCAPNRHLTLVDVSASKLQAQDSVAAFGAIIVDPRIMSRKLAMVVGSSLARMQVRRILLRADAECFDSVAAARLWLFSDGVVGCG